jgi:hypothetical protein
LTDGFLRVNLWFHGQCHARYVHRIVMEAFRQIPDDPFARFESVHIDTDRMNNALGNLAYVSKRANCRRRPVWRHYNPDDSRTF